MTIKFVCKDIKKGSEHLYFKDMRVGDTAKIISEIGHKGEIVLCTYGDRVVSLTNPVFTWSCKNDCQLEVEFVDLEIKVIHH